VPQHVLDLRRLQALRVPHAPLWLCGPQVVLLACGSASACTTRESSGVSQAPQPAVPPSAGTPTKTHTSAGVDGSASTDGWTNFKPSADTRTVYVSCGGGDDQNDGRSPSSAKRTLAAGIALLRNGSPDWLLLERGGVWHESLGQWKKSGRSASEPMLVSTYGDAPARPRLDTGARAGIITNGGGGSPATIDNLAIVGLHFHADGYTGGGNCIGGQFLQPASHVLIEDCKFEGYSGNLVFQGYGGRHSDFRLRRSVIVDAYAIHSVGGHSQGLYAYAVDGLLIEENVFDHNGWNEKVAGAGADIFSHNLYIDNDNTAVVVRGNVIANASSHGMQLRPGGTVVDNLFVRNSIALSVGGGNNPEPNGVTADVRGNVIVEGKNIDASEPRGWAMWFANIASGHVARNLIANNTLGTQPVTITLDGEHKGDARASIGVHKLKIEHNVCFEWGGSILVKGDAKEISEVELVDNDLQELKGRQPLIEFTDAAARAGIHVEGNRMHSELAAPEAWVSIPGSARGRSKKARANDSTGDDWSSQRKRASYSAPQRSVAAYSGGGGMTGGTGTLDAFLARVRAQSKATEVPEFTAAAVNRYLRGGFDLTFE
jgi:hypothetical protein